MNKKGFAFIETIVTLTVLLVALTTLYAVFSNLLEQERRKTDYNRASDKFALYYIKESMISGDKKVDSMKEYIGFDKKVNKYYDLNHIAVCNCKDDLKIDKGCIANASLSVNFKRFINSYNTCASSNNKVIIFGEFKTNNKYTYASIYYPEMGDEE